MYDFMISFSVLLGAGKALNFLFLISCITEQYQLPFLLIES